MEKDNLTQVISEYKSSTYIFDTDKLANRVMLIKDVLKGKADVCFAMKSNPFLTKNIDENIDKFEVCSPGEYEICNRNSINPEKIIISGVNKTMDSMERICSLSNCKGTYTIESYEHLKILKEISEKMDKNLRVIIRLSSGNQFGVDKENFEIILKECINSRHLLFCGIHFYSGTQKKISKVIKEINMLDEYALYLKNTYSVDVSELEYGPGLMVTYFESDKPVSATEQLEQLYEVLDNIRNFEHCTVEMGRFIASESGYYLTKIVDIKQNDNVNYAIIDGGIHQLNYYGQIMGMKKPFMELISNHENGEDGYYNICGSLCTVNDVIVKGAQFKKLHKGDYFLFKNCGAYSVTEGMALFLSRELPQVLLYSKEKGYAQVRQPVLTDKFNS